jgi:hypothetical protein
MGHLKLKSELLTSPRLGEGIFDYLCREKSQAWGAYSEKIDDPE